MWSHRDSRCHHSSTEHVVFQRPAPEQRSRWNNHCVRYFFCERFPRPLDILFCSNGVSSTFIFCNNFSSLLMINFRSNIINRIASLAATGTEELLRLIDWKSYSWFLSCSFNFFFLFLLNYKKSSRVILILHYFQLFLLEIFRNICYHSWLTKRRWK